MNFGRHKITTSLDARKYQKILGGAGILTTCGLLFYERQYIRKFIYKLLNKKEPETATEQKSPDYIYIKYHIYRESMRILHAQEEEDKKWINVIIHPFGKWWKSFKHSVAWRLLKIAQHGGQHERLKAIYQLANIDHLKDWDFQHLAQICDAQTGVSLARSGCDSRWFLPVHMRGVMKNPKIMLAELRRMLENLSPNNCVSNFLKKYFDASEISDLDADDFYMVNSKVSVHDSDLLKEIISFLHHITKDEDVSEKIIKDGGLIHLLELMKTFTGDNETLSTLCKVLANLSLVRNCIHDFFVTGWVGVLARWQEHPDLRLQVIASKTLANLDIDDPNYAQYPPNVYPLYPRCRMRTKPKGDIVFIHGLLGGVFITWRQKDRAPTELGLYGKNAFYQSESEEQYIIGENKRLNGKTSKKNGNGNANSGSDNESANSNVNEKENINSNDKSNSNANSKDDSKIQNDDIFKHAQTETIRQREPLLSNITSKKKNKVYSISDRATKELVETLQTSAELHPDWEVVHPDVPLKANVSCTGEFSVSGNEWVNDDNNEEYTNCWPMDWLPEDHPNVRIIGIDYTSAVTEWSANFTKYCPCEKGQGHIDMRANSLLSRISRSKVGENRPVVWIGHSMGGILTKLILMKSLEDPDPKVQNLAKNTKGIIFLGTPHRGSPIAKWKQHMQLILSPSIEVKEMEEGAPRLIDLHKRFMQCLRNQLRNVNIVSIAEGTPTMLTTFKFPLRIVTEESARIDYGDFYLLKDDHLSLSKPIYRQSFLYQRLLQVIDKSLAEPQVPEENNNVVTHKLAPLKNVVVTVCNIFPHFLYKLS